MPSKVNSAPPVATTTQPFSRAQALYIPYIPGEHPVPPNIADMILFMLLYIPSSGPFALSLKTVTSVATLKDKWITYVPSVSKRQQSR